MGAFFPQFLFDFTIFYSFSGLDNTQLLFIGMVVILTNLYLHIALSKKHLLYSFPLSLFLLGGIGLRIATSPFSLSYLFHYLIFSLLLLVLVVDHRLYLYIPAEFKAPLAKTRVEVEKVSLPSFSSIHPKPVTTGSNISSIVSTFSKAITDVKNTMMTKLGLGSPSPSTAASYDKSSDASFTSSPLTEDASTELTDFIHPVEKNANYIKTTKQLITDLESISLDHLDSKINKTKLEDHSFLDSFFSTPSKPLVKQQPTDSSDLSTILDTLDEGAVIISRGVVKAVNDKFASLIEKPKTDILDHDFINFIAPEGFASFKSHCSQRLAGESTQSFPVVLLTKKYEKVPLQAMIKPVKIHGKEIEITIFQHKNT
jgi:hypothetical protein